MFAHQHAWFSTTVPETHQQLWANEQGKASANFLDPQVKYFFSNDVNEPQTRKLLDETDKVVFASQWIADSADVRFRRPLGSYVLQDHTIEPYNPPPPPYTPPHSHPQYQRFRRSLDSTISTPSRLPHNYQPVDLTVESSPPPTISRLDRQNNRNSAPRPRVSTSESSIFEFDADVEMVERVLRGRRRHRSDDVAGADVDAQDDRADVEAGAVINTNVVETSDEDEEPLPSKRIRKLPNNFGRRDTRNQKTRGKVVAIEKEDESFFQDVQSSSAKHSSAFPTLGSSRYHPPPILPLDRRETITVAEIFSRVRSIADEDLQTDEDVTDWLLRDVRDFTPGKNGCIARLNPAWKARTT